MKRMITASICTLMLGLTPISGQKVSTELNLMYGKCWVRDDGLGNPTGFNINILQQISSRTELKFGYTTSRGDDRRYSYFYSGYHDPYPEMRLYETINERFRVNVYQFGFMREISASKFRALKVGTGLCLFRVGETERWTTTGITREIDHDNRLGIVLDISIEDDFNLSNWVLRLGFSHKFLIGMSDTRPSATSGGSAYNSSDGFTTTELRIGLGYRLYWGDEEEQIEYAEGGT